MERVLQELSVVLFVSLHQSLHHRLELVQTYRTVSVHVNL